MATIEKPEEHVALSEATQDANMTMPEAQPEETAISADEDEAMDDLFGEEQDVDNARNDDAEEPSSPVGANERLSSPERLQRHAMEYEEEDAPASVVEQILEATVRIPNIPLPKSSDDTHWVIRMPNFVKVDSKPFHPDTYVGPEQEDEDLKSATGREKDMAIKLRVENTLRWRWTKDKNGVDCKQSNSRVIRWSDGSLSLRLGKELFDITKTIDTSGAVSRSTLGAPNPSQAQSQSQTQQQLPENPTGRAGLTYLVAQHKHAFILQSEAIIAGHMTLRPTGMQSETHRMLVRAVGQKHNKIARLRMAPDPIRDPERELMEEMKRDKRPRKVRPVPVEDDDMDILGPRPERRKTVPNKRRRRIDMDMWSDEDEDEEEPVMFSDDDGEGTRRASPKKKEDKRAGEYVTDDFVVSDEEGGSDEEESSRRKRRRNPADDQSEDELDMLDAKIARQEQQRQRQGSGDEDAAGSVVDEGDTKAMDVESEDDDDFKVRRTGGGTRRKRAIQEDDDDDDDDE